MGAVTVTLYAIRRAAISESCLQGMGESVPRLRNERSRRQVLLERVELRADQPHATVRDVRRVLEQPSLTHFPKQARHRADGELGKTTDLADADRRAIRGGTCGDAE